MVARIWLERERYEEKQNWPANHFADNWLFTQEYDRTMMPVNNASIMGLSIISSLSFSKAYLCAKMKQFLCF